MIFAPHFILYIHIYMHAKYWGQKNEKGKNNEETSTLTTF